MSRVPSPISKLKKLASEIPNLADALYHFQYMPTAEDRAAAIIEVTSLEAALENAIKTKLIPLNKDDYRELFAPEGPLGTFATKIKLAYALGLYGKHTRKDLDIIRWIRNAFAHSRKPLWFHTEVVADAIDLLTVTKRTPNLAEFKGVEQPLDTPRKKFLASTMLLNGALSRIHFPALYELDPESAPLD